MNLLMVEHLLSTEFFRTAIKAAKTPATLDAKSGNYHLPYPKSTAWLFKFFAISFFALGVGIPFLQTNSWVGLTLLIVAGCCFVSFSLALFRETFATNIFYNDFHLATHNPLLHSTQTTPWIEIASIDYSETFYWFVLKSTRGQKIRISRFRTGFNDFTRIANQKLLPDVANDFSAMIAVYHSKGIGP